MLASSSPAPFPFVYHSPKRWFAIALFILTLLLLIGTWIERNLSSPTIHTQPIISLTSPYTEGSIPVRTTTTTFHIMGQRFSEKSPITFLLDSYPAPGIAAIQSDSRGNIITTLTVRANWPVGQHTITAEDARGDITKVGIPVEIVTPGQAGTPGPNGAPSDDESMTILATLQTFGGPESFTLIITASPNGETVCRRRDTGQPHTQTGTNGGFAYTETLIATCSGNYKEGNLFYIETITSERLAFKDGLVCTVQVPFVANSLTGTFINTTDITGTYSQEAVTTTCPGEGGPTTIAPQSGTWTGIATKK